MMQILHLVFTAEKDVVDELKVSECFSTTDHSMEHNMIIIRNFITKTQDQLPNLINGI